MKAIIHIGMPKTGSSSIQATLYNSDLGNIRYFDWNSNQHGALIAGICGLRWHRFVRLFSEEHRQDLIDRFTAKFEKGVAETGADTFIISAEMLFWLSRDSLQKIKDFFDRYASSYEVIGYIRDPYGYTSSALQQNLKTGTKDFKAIAHWPQYKTHIENYFSVFGRENVHLKMFDRKHMKDGDVVADFYDAIGTELDPEKIVRTNESLSVNACALLYIERRLGDGFDNRTLESATAERRFISRLSTVDGKSFKVAHDLLAGVANKNRTQIEWVEDVLGREFPKPSSSSSDGVRNNADMYDIARNSMGQLKELLDQAVKEHEAETIDDIGNFMSALMASQEPPTKSDA